MRYPKSFRQISIAGIAAAAFVSVSTGAIAQGKDYILNTASTGGTYHPVGTALATLTKVKLLPTEKFSLTAVNSAGSGANIQAMGADTAQFAILQGLFGAYAASGTGPVSEPQKNVQSITMLWLNVEQFVLANEFVKSGTLSDLIPLKGKSMGMGAKNSGTLESNRVLLRGLGIDIEKDYDLVYAGFGPTADALADGKAVGAGLGAGPPTGALTKLMAANAGKFTLLGVTADEARKVDDGRNLWVPYTIKAGTYPGQDKDVATVAQPNFLAVNADVSDEHVYKLTKSIYENLAFLQAIHNATKVMDIKSAMAGLPVPLHPGAAKYYTEAGLTVPGHLKAK
ncbi:MAG: TAXI family TRAP transporter solute-binding subunit [Rhodospirillaceae bacterium]